VLPQYPFRLQIGVADEQKSLADGLELQGGWALVVTAVNNSNVVVVSICAKALIACTDFLSNIRWKDLVLITITVLFLVNYNCVEVIEN